MTERVAFVTGGSRGIGAGICESLLKNGYRVAVGYFQNQALAEELIQAHPDHAIAVSVDIRSKESVAHAFAEIRKRLAPVDVLVNNAAMGDEKPFLELTDEDWEAVLSANLLGAVRCIREAIPDMQKNQFGRIINISSVAGQWGGVYRVHYAVTKASLINLTRSLAKLYSKDGITTNAIAPGLIETDLTRVELQKPEVQAKVQEIPCKRLGTPDEVGAAVVYLASPEAAYITGHTLNLNGGMYFG